MVADLGCLGKPRRLPDRPLRIGRRAVRRHDSRTVCGVLAAIDENHIADVHARRRRRSRRVHLAGRHSKKPPMAAHGADEQCVRRVALPTTATSRNKTGRRTH